MTRPVEYTDIVSVHVDHVLPTTLSDAWELIVSCPELWLGDAVRVEMDGTYAVDGCLESAHAYGRIEEVALLERVVRTWHPQVWDDAAIVEISTIEAGPVSTQVSVHVEEVPEHVGLDAITRHWQTALERLATAIGEPRRPQAA
jgi:hypothetical protein